MEYRSVADLHNTIIRNLHRVPRDIDLVVGIPRSGLLAGTMMALAMNLPLADVEGFLSRRILATGRTRARAQFRRDFADLKTVLVVDDSLRTGGSMLEARQRLTSERPDVRFVFCAIYGQFKAHEGVDLVLEVVPLPRVFEWNVLHHSVLERSCVDIDGVLCVDPTEQENDDGVAYEKFLLNATSLHTPTRRIGYLVTSRLEKYRKQTEAWLRDRDIAYDELIMLDLPSKAERQRQGSHASFKGETYKRLESPLFIESDIRQAPQIARISGKPVLCLETREMVMPDGFSRAAMAQSLKHFPRRAPQRLRRIARELLGDSLYGQLKRHFGR